ncbi:hypothetical protein [Nocardia asteroides]|uniref:hypothetical protein n=1 Tax=Nocardia asteroides TaxID=1824 RepID=UPI001E48B312|nr:hypothetical protein [Nocardia asteroides]UGT54754.1 hypothetical protein LTT85_29780 [Nocardia asteroides]
MPPVVVPREPVFVNLKDHLVDHGYRWIDVTPFDLTAPYAPDAEIIAAVMDSVPYRNGHIGGGDDPHGTIVHRRLRAADAVYFLRDLGDDALCDYGRIHGEYNEFLTVDRTGREVALILAGDD